MQHIPREIHFIYLFIHLFQSKKKGPDAGIDSNTNNIYNMQHGEGKSRETQLVFLPLR